MNEERERIKSRSKASSELVLETLRFPFNFVRGPYHLTLTLILAVAKFTGMLPISWLVVIMPTVLAILCTYYIVTSFTIYFIAVERVNRHAVDKLKKLLNDDEEDHS